MIIGSYVKNLKPGTKIEVSGKEKSYKYIPAIILREATKEEYIKESEEDGIRDKIAPENILNNAYFYEVSVD